LSTFFLLRAHQFHFSLFPFVFSFAAATDPADLIKEMCTTMVNEFIHKSPSRAEYPVNSDSDDISDFGDDDRVSYKSADEESPDKDVEDDSDDDNKQ
jgi:hypothetical protein